MNDRVVAGEGRLPGGRIEGGAIGTLTVCGVREEKYMFFLVRSSRV